MLTVDIASSGLRVTRIAFGTASLHHLPQPRDRQALLHAARDAGIGHFDTAPLYGHGLAESALATFARAGSEITIATKVGLYPPGGAGQSRAEVVARKLAGRLLPALSRPVVDLSVAAARASLDGSLKRLRRERIDLLLLHEPQHALYASDEWRRWLDAERDRIGLVGLAGEAAQLLPFVRAGEPVSRVLQTRDSLEGAEAAPLRALGRAPQFTFGHLARRPAADRLSVAERLAQALAADPAGVLIVSTRRAEKLRELAAAADR